MTRPTFSDIALCPKHDKQSRTGDGIRDRLEDCKACSRLLALAELRTLLPPGSTAYTILRSVSRSGMSRVMGLVVAANNPPIHDLTYKVSLVLDYKMDRDKWGLKVSGGGMDMGFAVVYDLACTLYPKGDATESRPGYTLTHRWL